jgi:hypothetical protein
MNKITEKYKKFLFRWLDAIFDDDKFNKDFLIEKNYLIILSDSEYIITVNLLKGRINVTAGLFHKMHSFFGVSYGDLSDLFREYLSEKLDFDFSRYPVGPN